MFAHDSVRICCGTKALHLIQVILILRSLRKQFLTSWYLVFLGLFSNEEPELRGLQVLES